MSSHTKGVLLMVLSTLFLSLNATAVKLLELSAYEKVFFRNLLGVIILLFLIKREQLYVPKEPRKFLLLRVSFGLTAMILYYITIDHMILSDAVMINKLNSFFVIIFAGLFLHEKIRKSQIIAIFIAFVGALFVIKPTLDSSMIYALLGLASAMLGGGAYVLVRRLKVLHPIVIVFYFTLFNTLGSGLLMLKDFQMPTGSEWWIILFMGLSATLGQIALTTSYRFAPASELSIYNYTNILFTIWFAFYLFGTIPDLYSTIGGILIFAAGYLQFRTKKSISTM